jgi:flap endonuclease-1
VKEKKTLEAVLSHVKWESQTPADQIFSFFKEPPAKTVEIERRNPDPEAVRRIMIDDHDFTQDRLQRTLDKLSGAHDDRKQSSLQKFL